MKQGFRDPYPDVEQLPDGKRWRLKQHGWTYNPWKRRGVGEIHVPYGYVTDFATIPRVFWRVLHPTGRYGSAAIVHDWLCTEAKRNGIYWVKSHRLAADIFSDAMQELGVRAWRRTIMYRAVVLFGPKWSA